MPFPKIDAIHFDQELPPGDLCQIFAGTHGTTPVIVKVARDKGNNDLVQAETRMIRRLYPPGTRDEKFYRYLSRPVLGGVAGGLAYNVVERAQDSSGTAGSPDYVSLAQIIEAYPGGIDFRDAAWMFKRALVVLGWVHRKNVVHGNVTPPHLLVHPLGHGGKLIDWSYAVVVKPDPKAKPDTRHPKPEARPTAWARLLDEEDETASILEEEPGLAYIRAITPKYGSSYPQEVMTKQPPTAATDIYMLAHTFVRVLGGGPISNTVPSSVPRAIRELLEECLREEPARRPQDAWLLHDRFDEALRRLVGDPVYRPFTMP